MSEKKEQLVHVDVTTERPTLEIGKKYKLVMYDMAMYRDDDGDRVYYKEFDILYKGGDIINFCYDYIFYDSQFNSTPNPEYFDEYFIRVRKATEEDLNEHLWWNHSNGMSADYIFEKYTKVRIAHVNPTVMKDDPMQFMTIGLWIKDYTPYIIEI